jgi:hypothetical protein
MKKSRRPEGAAAFDFLALGPVSLRKRPQP